MLRFSTLLVHTSLLVYVLGFPQLPFQSDMAQVKGEGKCRHHLWVFSVILPLQIKKSYGGVNFNVQREIQLWPQAAAHGAKGRPCHLAGAEAHAAVHL